MLGETEMGRWEEIGAGVGAKLDSGFRGRVRVPGLLGDWDETKTRHSPRPRKADSPKPPSTQEKRHLISCLSVLRRRGIAND